MNKHIKTNRLSRVSVPSKTYPGHIKVSHDAVDGQPKPYLGYSRGRGMPGAHEPVEEYSTNARKTFDKAFKHTTNGKLLNIKSVEKCGKWTCEYYSVKKSSQCVMFNNAKDCEIHEQRRKKSRRKKAK